MNLWESKIQSISLVAIFKVVLTDVLKVPLNYPQIAIYMYISICG